MTQYTAENIRNIALAGHGSAGKTSLAEALLFKAGATDRLGKVLSSLEYAMDGLSTVLSTCRNDPWNRFGSSPTHDRTHAIRHHAIIAEFWQRLYRSQSGHT